MSVDVLYVRCDFRVAHAAQKLVVVDTPAHKVLSNSHLRGRACGGITTRRLVGGLVSRFLVVVIVHDSSYALTPTSCLFFCDRWIVRRCVAVAQQRSRLEFWWKQEAHLLVLFHEVRHVRPIVKCLEMLLCKDLRARPRPTAAAAFRFPFRHVRRRRPSARRALDEARLHHRTEHVEYVVRAVALLSFHRNLSQLSRHLGRESGV
mmetsp:Transcript_8372/g.22300  ORF Transcript_8372/g.22300 Transcript_8372/m.22300 type:complete len:205 (+) Transcript_8372:2412-3026(+)